MSRTVFRISAAFLAGALALAAFSLFLSDHYTAEQRRLAAAGDFRGAGEAARIAVRLDPFDTDPLEARSFLLQQQGKDQEAAEVLKEAINRDPNNYMPYLMLGNLEMVQLGDLEAAAGSYRKVLELNPKASVARSSLAQALVRSGKLKEAREEYEKLRRDGEITTQGLYDLGRIYVRTGKPEEGLKAIRAARHRAERDLAKADGEERAQIKSFIQSMDLAIADALVVERKYGAARSKVAESGADQAPAILELLYTDPEGYRESVVNSGLY